MTAQLVKTMFDKYGEENLLKVTMDNTMVLIIDKDTVYEWDYDNEVLVVKEDNYVMPEMVHFMPQKITAIYPFEVIQNMIFKRG